VLRRPVLHWEINSSFLYILWFRVSENGAFVSDAVVLCGLDKQCRSGQPPGCPLRVRRCVHACLSVNAGDGITDASPYWKGIFRASLVNFKLHHSFKGEFAVSKYYQDGSDYRLCQ
jgi:hypothetical protein